MLPFRRRRAAVGRRCRNQHQDQAGLRIHHDADRTHFARQKRTIAVMANERDRLPGRYQAAPARLDAHRRNEPVEAGVGDKRRLCRHAGAGCN